MRRKNCQEKMNLEKTFTKIKQVNNIFNEILNEELLNEINKDIIK